MADKIIPILMYYSIKTVKKTETMRSLHVAPNAFRRQMFILKKLGFRGCSIKEVKDALQSGSTEKLVGLTFDDGYENFFTNALPTIITNKFSATVFPVASMVGDANIWDTEKHSGISRNPLMSWHQLKHCISQGIEIGCHSMTHKSLTDCETELTSEIVFAKQILENKLNINITSYCYPYGHYNNKIINRIRDAGFSSGVTMIRSRATYSDPCYELPRIPITWHTRPHLFLIKLLTAYEDNRRNK